MAGPAFVAGSGEVIAGSPDFQRWLAALRAEAGATGIRPSTIAAALTDLKPIPRVIELDRRQPEVRLTLAEYVAGVVTPERVRRGRALLRENRAVLGQVGRRYGVQPRFIVALWGVESDYGRRTGAFPVIGSLATLAYDGRRSAYFREELLQALRILDGGHVTAGGMLGSWAGAMGQNQFMPSSFHRFAVDHDGDGRRDIWTSRADVFASTANYLARSGWRDDQTWGRPVRLPDGFDPRLAGLDVEKPLADWRELGVRASGGQELPALALPASILVDRAGGPSYAVYPNYKVLLRWNRSHHFAVAVGRLADAVGDS